MLCSLETVSIRPYRLLMAPPTFLSSGGCLWAWQKTCRAQRVSRDHTAGHKREDFRTKRAWRRSHVDSTHQPVRAGGYPIGDSPSDRIVASKRGRNRVVARIEVPGAGGTSARPSARPRNPWKPCARSENGCPVDGSRGSRPI